MTASRTFEDLLEQAFGEWADEADVRVDSFGLAAFLAGGDDAPWSRQSTGTRRWMIAALAAALLLAALLSALVVGAYVLRHQHHYDGIFAPLPDMSITRDSPILVTLHDGRVLIAGGQQSTPSKSIALEIFDPSSSTYIELGGDIPIGSGSAAELAGDRVLVLTDELPNQVEHVYIVDVAAGLSRELVPDVDFPSAAVGVEPTMLKLPDSRVLITGGKDPGGGGGLTSALIFDGISQTFQATGSMQIPRMYHALVPLSDGRVLVAGGRSAWFQASPFYGRDGLLDDAEAYDPRTGSFSLIGRLPSVRGNAWGAALPDGRVIIVQDAATDSAWGAGTINDAVDIYEPADSKFTAVDVNWPGQATMTSLTDGRVLLTGSTSGEFAPTSTRLTPWAGVYDPISGQLALTASPRAIFPSTSVLGDGRVLIAGGYSATQAGDPSVPWVEIFQ